MTEDLAPDSLIGTSLAGFILTAELGSGGSATVYRAERTAPVLVKRAIKVIHQGQGRRLGKRFKQEAELLQKLEHPNIVKFYDATTERGRLFMVLELLEGQTLGGRLRVWREQEILPPLAEVLEIMAQAAEGVAFAHGFDEARPKEGIAAKTREVVVHRDLKPDNLFVTDEGVTKILDFGVAKVLDDPGQKHQTTAGSVAMATVPYLAPELWSTKEVPNPKPTPQSDVYSLGLTLFEALTRQHPYGNTDTIGYWQAHREALVPALRSVRQDAPEELERLINKATAKNPVDRHPTAKEFGEEIRAVQRLLQVASGPSAIGKIAAAKNEIGPGTRTTADIPIVRPAEQAEESTAKINVSEHVGRDNRTLALWFWMVLLGVGLTAIVVFVIVSWNKNQDPGPLPVSSASALPSAVAPLASSASIAPPVPSASAQAKAEVCPSGMVFIPKGTFKIGSEDGPDEEKGGGDTTVEAFCMDKTEVTVRAYAECKDCPAAGTGAYCNGGKKDRLQHPINCVNWIAATKYCEKNGKRLPTEEEWEYAARGTDGRKYPWGNDPPGKQLCWDGPGNDVGRGKRLSTCEVGSFPGGESFYKVLDLAGNVWEWTSSPYTINYSQISKSNPDNIVRVLRGGSWSKGTALFARASGRYWNSPSFRGDGVGFRCARGSLKDG